MKELFKRSTVLVAALFLASMLSDAQAADVGKQEYIDSCASCHGENGKGGGPVAGFLKQKVPDLTVLAKNSAGVFPFARVYDVIDGRRTVAVHGQRDMPIWGKTYTEEVAKYGEGIVSAEEFRSIARGRIIALIGYIYSLQEK